MTLTHDGVLLKMLGSPRCDRHRFSKRIRPVEKRRDWCRWCQSILRGDAPCPVRAAMQENAKE